MMHSGMAIPRSRQVVDQLLRPTGRSSARPAPIREMMTQTSARCRAKSLCAIGSGSGRWESGRTPPARRRGTPWASKTARCAASLGRMAATKTASAGRGEEDTGGFEHGRLRPGHCPGSRHYVIRPGGLLHSSPRPPSRTRAAGRRPDWIPVEVRIPDRTTAVPAGFRTRACGELEAWSFPSPPVDLPPQPWTGRFDGDGGEHRRWWQAVAPYADGAARGGRHGASPTPGRHPAGLRQRRRRPPEQGPHRARRAPAAIRAALGPLAFHLDRAVSDAGDVVVAGGALEAGQARAGQADYRNARRRQPHRGAGRRPRNRLRQLPGRGRVRSRPGRQAAGRPEP